MEVQKEFSLTFSKAITMVLSVLKMQWSLINLILNII